MAVEQSGKSSWTLTDEQGSLIGVYCQTATAGQHGLLAIYAYAPDDSYAKGGDRNVIFDASALPRLDVGFQGRELDPTTKLYDFRSRFYDPNTGTFVSEDGIGIADDLNRYRLNRNSSPNYTDPSGNLVVATAVAVTTVVGLYLAKNAVVAGLETGAEYAFAQMTGDTSFGSRGSCAAGSCCTPVANAR